MKRISLIGCLIYAVAFIAYLWAGAWSINLLTNYFGKDLPGVVDAIIGLLLGWISILVGFIIWLIQ